MTVPVLRILQAVFCTTLEFAGCPDPDADAVVVVMPECVRETDRGPFDDDDRAPRRLKCEHSSGVATAKRAADDIVWIERTVPGRKGQANTSRARVCVVKTRKMTWCDLINIFTLFGALLICLFRVSATHAPFLSRLFAPSVQFPSRRVPAYFAVSPGWGRC